MLALYPVHGTTVLYPATVVQGPRKVPACQVFTRCSQQGGVWVQRKEDVYLLEFQDDEGEHRLVDARWVVPLPENYGEKDD